MKSVTFSFTANFPLKKVKACFTSPDFAKLHKASKLFSKTGIYKAEKNMIVRTLVLANVPKPAFPVVAIITFSELNDGAATKTEALFVNVPEEKAVEIKALGKIINADITTFYEPKPVAPVKAKATKTQKAGQKKAVATSAKKTAKPKADASIVSAKKPNAKKPDAVKKVSANPKRSRPAKKTN